jgi:hypothetical protein
MQVKPPHGWNAVVWELAIVTVGVLSALAAQEWAERLSWRGKVAATERALRVWGANWQSGGKRQLVEPAAMALPHY